jgi:hypothetical protein
MQGGLYLDSTSKPKTYDFVMSEKTIEGIYSLDGDTLRLCHDTKRPVSFTTQKDRQQVLFVLRRIHGPEVFPYRLADGTRAFPTLIEREKKATPPQNAPTSKYNNKYDLGPTVPEREEPPATKNRQQEFQVKAGEGKRITVESKDTKEQSSGKKDRKEDERASGNVKVGRGPADYKTIFVKTSGVIAEHFETIENANQYEGRIDARGKVPGNVAPGVIRIAAVAIQPVEGGGGFSIEVRINTVNEVKAKAEIIGHDAELEGEIVQRIKVQLNAKLLDSTPLPL